MDFILSQNNNEIVLVFPVIPNGGITVSRGQRNETFDGINGEMQALGTLGLASFEIESFFPTRYYPFMRMLSSEDGWRYVRTIEACRARQLPFRGILLDNRGREVFNLPLSVESFEYGVDQAHDISYRISFREYRFAAMPLTATLPAQASPAGAVPTMAPSPLTQVVTDSQAAAQDGGSFTRLYTAADLAKLGTDVKAKLSGLVAEDTLLQTQIDQLVAPTGDAPSAAEVENARIGVDSTVYPTLGQAIRGQVADLKSALNMNALQLITTIDTNQWLDVSSVQTENPNEYIFTITSHFNSQIIIFFDNVSKIQYSLQYEHGSNNVGTGRAFKIDDTVVSSPIYGAACFVADLSDTTLKLVSRQDLKSTHRLIAMIAGSEPSFNIQAFGNSKLFPFITFDRYRLAYVFNVNPEYIGCLTWAKNGNTYTVTKNIDNFICYGSLDKLGPKANFRILGNMDQANPGDYSIFIPSSLSYNSLPGSAYVVINLKNETLEIINRLTLNRGIYKYAVLGAIYDTHFKFFSAGAEMLFTNTFAVSNENQVLIEKQATLNTFNNDNFTAFFGSVHYYPEEYKIIIDKCMFVPFKTPGIFLNKSTVTYTLDWSNDSDLNYARSVYYDKNLDDFIVLTARNIDAQNRILKKSDYVLLCTVFRNDFVFTSGSHKPGVWFVNGTDYYAQVVPSASDLIKAFMRVGVCGDSLSVGYMYNKQTQTITRRMLEYSWPKQVMRDTGRIWLNIGDSGQNTLTWCSSATYGKVQAEASGNKCQSYVIGLGENDQSTDGIHGVPLGTQSDVTSNPDQVATTYYGGYSRIIAILKRINPSCKIFCCTNPKAGSRRKDYNEAIRYITDTYYASDSNVILVDLAKICPQLYGENSFLAKDSAAIQGGHYSAVGYSRIATIMERVLSKIIEENYSTMYDIAFIPYDTSDPTPDTMV